LKWIRGNAFSGVTNPGAGTFILDRWSCLRNGTTLTGSWNVSFAGVFILGTQFYITKNYLDFTLNAQQPTMAAADFYGVQQTIEGPFWRELMADVTSVSLLVRSSVANLKFSLCLRDSPTAPTRSLVKLCTLGAAGT
jgi:hypothetical protein